LLEVYWTAQTIKPETKTYLEKKEVNY